MKPPILHPASQVGAGLSGAETSGHPGGKAWSFRGVEFWLWGVGFGLTTVCLGFGV